MGARDIGYQFQVVAAPIEDSSLVPRTPPIRQLTSRTSSFKRFDNLFWPLDILDADTEMQTHTHTQEAGGGRGRKGRKQIS